VETQATNIDLPALWQQILTLLNEPASNLTAAFVLYGIITLVLLLIVVVALIFLGSTTEDDDEDELGEVDIEVEPLEVERARAAIDAAPSGEVVEGIPDTASALPRRSSRATTERVKAPKVPQTPRARLIAAGIGIGVVLVVWVLTGMSTSANAVCDGCHVITPHNSLAEGTADPHAGRSCVACHEPGGGFGRYFSDVPARLLHFVDRGMTLGVQGEYGRIEQSACLSCHRDILEGVQLNEDRGIRMSHAEPLAAAVRCLGCHAPASGVVGAHKVGMNPCLRCHDSKSASAECETCHDKNASAAARVRTASLASRQIREISCGGCHDEKKECDSCHGLRMPHSLTFKQSAHARAGAVDFWFNGGRTCGKCHTATRNPCQKCHDPSLGKGHPVSLAKEHTVATEAACDKCHQQWQFQKGRDFCADVCHTPAAIEQSPR
jgi:hypothetical protein